MYGNASQITIDAESNRPHFDLVSSNAEITRTWYEMLHFLFVNYRRRRFGFSCADFPFDLVAFRRKLCGIVTRCAKSENSFVHEVCFKGANAIFEMFWFFYTFDEREKRWLIISAFFTETAQLFHLTDNRMTYLKCSCNFDNYTFHKLLIDLW